LLTGLESSKLAKASIHRTADEFDRLAVKAEAERARRTGGCIGQGALPPSPSCGRMRTFIFDISNSAPASIGAFVYPFRSGSALLTMILCR
jgi:hypothetical protein